MEVFRWSAVLDCEVFSTIRGNVPEFFRRSLASEALHCGLNSPVPFLVKSEGISLNSRGPLALYAPRTIADINSAWSAIKSLLNDLPEDLRSNSIVLEAVQSVERLFQRGPQEVRELHPDEVLSITSSESICVHDSGLGITCDCSLLPDGASEVSVVLTASYLVGLGSREAAMKLTAVVAKSSPSSQPTISPTVFPTILPTPLPTVLPTPSPTVSPTISPTLSPTVAPTPNPDRLCVTITGTMYGDRDRPGGLYVPYKFCGGCPLGPYCCGDLSEGCEWVRHWVPHDTNHMVGCCNNNYCSWQCRYYGYSMWGGCCYV